MFSIVIITRKTAETAENPPRLPKPPSVTDYHGNTILANV